MNKRLILYSALAGVGFLAFASSLSLTGGSATSENTDSQSRKAKTIGITSEISPLADSSDDEDINATITYNYTSHANTDGWSSSAHPGDWAVHNFRVTPLGSDTEATLVERYFDAATTAAEKVLTQTITGLGPGKYRVKIYASANRANGVGTWDGDPTQMAAVFANEGVTNMTAVDNNTLTSDEPVLYTVTGTVGTDGELEFGIKTLDGGVGHVNWFCAQLYAIEQATTIKEVYDETLAANEKYRDLYPDAAPEKMEKLFAVPTAQTRTAYQAAIDQMLDPLTLRAVVESNALAEGLGAIVMNTSITNPNAENGTDGWELESTDGKIVSLSDVNERPTLSSGNSVENYFDGTHATDWGNGNWTNIFTQKINLPTGKYRISVLARGREVLEWYRFAVGASDANFSVIGEKGANATESEVGGWFKCVDMAFVGAPDYSTFGKGWENYSIDFEVNPTSTEESADVKIGVLAHSVAGWQWESFTYFRLVQLEADPTANYNAAKAAAQEALGNEEYDVVTGVERTKLQNSIPATDPTTSAGKKSAANEMLTATNAFKEAKTAYSAFKDAKETYAPYADDNSLAAPEKLAALKALLPDVDNAEDAAANAASLQSVGREAVLSNSIAEGAENRQDMTGRISQPKIDQNEIEGWEDTPTGHDAKVRVLNNQAPDGDHFTHYFDTDFYNNANGGGNELSQTAKIPAGKYRVALMARGSNNLDTYKLNANEKSIDLTHNGDNGQVFNHGWNDHTLDFETLGNEAKISVVAHASQSNCWASWNHFRLTKVGEIESKTENIPAKSHKAVCYPYAVGTYDASKIEFRTVTSVSTEKGQPVLVLTKVQNPVGGTPYLVFNSAANALDTEFGFVDVPVEDVVNASNTLLKGAFTKTTLGKDASAGAPRRAEGTEVYYTLNDAGTGFEKVNSLKEIPANSAYVAIPADQAASLPDALPIVGDSTTGLTFIEEDININAGVLYDLQGRRVINPTKGIYIRDGKKVVIR